MNFQALTTLFLAGLAFDEFFLVTGSIAIPKPSCASRRRQDETSRGVVCRFQYSGPRLAHGELVPRPFPFLCARRRHAICSPASHEGGRLLWSAPAERSVAGALAGNGAAVDDGVWTISLPSSKVVSRVACHRIQTLRDVGGTSLFGVGLGERCILPLLP